MSYLKSIQNKVDEILPSSAEITKVELEGPEIAIYTKNPAAFQENERLIGNLVSQLKKRVKVRADSSLLIPEAQAEKIIRKLIPEEAIITDIKFVPAFNQVLIEAIKIGLVIGKGGSTLKQIIIETGWTPEPVRAPVKESEVLKGIRYYLAKHAADRKKVLKNTAEKIYHDQEKKNNWLKLTCLGAGREVGRSCFLLESANSKVLLDCGLNFAASHPAELYPRFDLLNLPLSEIDAIVITHAHLDHSGFLPYLYTMGCKAPIYCTEPTRDLMILLQMDYIGVTGKEGKGTLYTEKDIMETLKYVIPIKYEDVTDITPDLRLTLYNAGHMLGSATVHIHEGDGEFNLIYTGDIKYGFTRLFNPAQNNFPRCEAIVIESTYGGPRSIQEPRRESEERLLQIINSTVQRGGNVLIPVFAVGRAQEVMLAIEQFYREGRLDPNANVYVDGMARQASAIHTAYPDYLKQNLQKRALRDDSPFVSEVFKPIESERVELAKGKGNVILAPSGMLQGGPAVEYLKHMADNPDNALIFVGYQAEGTLGRRIQGGAKEIPTTDPKTGKIKSLKINMFIDSISAFSGHSDRRELIGYLNRIKPRLKRVIVNHGDEKNAVSLAGYCRNSFKIESYSTRVMDSLLLYGSV
ncbi:MAG: beta-CASP ribonuclease aCPSF1 [Candidatus Diapherotrites archaeon]|nr:beta-CASP ribonuclease aCPSF1 [Candidatus Diapherotrites archaeon]